MDVFNIYSVLNNIPNINIIYIKYSFLYFFVKNKYNNTTKDIEIADNKNIIKYSFIYDSKQYINNSHIIIPIIKNNRCLFFNEITFYNYNLL